MITRESNEARENLGSVREGCKSFVQLSMIKVSDYKVELSEYKVVKPIIEKWHYSHSVRGLHASYCFGLFDENMF